LPPAETFVTARATTAQPLSVPELFDRVVPVSVLHNASPIRSSGYRDTVKLDGFWPSPPVSVTLTGAGSRRLPVSPGDGTPGRMTYTFDVPWFSRNGVYKAEVTLKDGTIRAVGLDVHLLT
jgi:hypothetical protein